MADLPSAPILTSGASKEFIPPEHRIAQSISHLEARDVWGSAFRRRWTFSLKLLGADAKTLYDFYISMNGPAGTFTFTDPQGEAGPETGNKWKCRFETETLKIEYGDAPTYWPGTVSIIQVL